MIICEFGDVGNFVHFIVCLFSSYCLKCVQNTVRHGTSKIEWSFVHSNIIGNRFFYCIEHKTRRLVCCQICCIYIQPSSFTIINVTVHIKSAINVHTVVANINVTVHIKSALTFYIYSFKVTSNKNIHDSSMCIVVVHSDVHLGSSVPGFSYFSFSPSQYIVV